MPHAHPMSQSTLVELEFNYMVIETQRRVVLLSLVWQMDALDLFEVRMQKLQSMICDNGIKSMYALSRYAQEYSV